MDFKFADAEPVQTSAGRTAEPNPFIDIVSQINGKTKKDGTPVAKSFTIDATDIKQVEKVTRQLGNAGLNVTPQCTVRRPYTMNDDGTATITFWTVERQERKRKPVETTPDAAPVAE